MSADQIRKLITNHRLYKIINMIIHDHISLNSGREMYAIGTVKGIKTVKRP